ncbi:MAG: cyanophycinase [Thermoanaerobaculia bacterium]
MRLRVAFAYLLLAFVAAAEHAPLRGHLVLIGGGKRPPEAMKKFVDLAGGPDAPIVIVPTASELPDTGDYYVKQFREMFGCSDVAALEVRSKADARRPELVAAARRARGVFFAGGDQARILTAFEHSPVLDAIREMWQRGGVIGGTSAGTACQSPLMITGEGDFSVIQTRSVELWNGLGFFPGVILDQHFVKRQRSNRLISAILEHPKLVGIGVDEDTAIWVRPDGAFEVIGRHQVMVLDARGAAVSRSPFENGRELLGVRDMRVHILAAGESFDLEKGVVIAPTSTAAESGAAVRH